MLLVLFIKVRIKKNKSMALTSTGEVYLWSDGKACGAHFYRRSILHGPMVKLVVLTSMGNVSS